MIKSSFLVAALSLTTLATAQELTVPPPPAPGLQTPATKKENHQTGGAQIAPEKTKTTTEELPAPAPTARVEETTDSARQARIQKRIKELGLYANIIQIMSNPGNYATQLQKNPELLREARVKKGELIAITKNLLDLPPYLFGIELDFTWDFSDPTKMVVTIVDRATKLKLGTVEFTSKGEAKSVTTEQANIDELAKAAQNTALAQTKDLDPNLIKIAALSAHVYHDSFRNNVTIDRTIKDDKLDPVFEGQIEQLAKDLLNVRDEYKNRSVMTYFTQLKDRNGRDVPRNWTVMTFKDKQTDSQLGAVGLLYEQDKPEGLRFINHRQNADTNISSQILDDMKKWNDEQKKNSQIQPDNTKQPFQTPPQQGQRNSDFDL